MRLRRVWTLLLLLALAGCASPASTESGSLPASPARTPPPEATLASPPTRGPEPYETRTDSQGSVTFEVTPIVLSVGAETLDFEVVMDTHSVDLTWDLATQSVLRTESGLQVQALSWPPGSGHHYSGTLSFPGRSPDGAALLEGVRSLTLIIRDTDVPQRVFAWDLQP